MRHERSHPSPSRSESQRDRRRKINTRTTRPRRPLLRLSDTVGGAPVEVPGAGGDEGADVQAAVPSAFRETARPAAEGRAKVPVRANQPTARSDPAPTYPSTAVTPSISVTNMFTPRLPTNVIYTSSGECLHQHSPLRLSGFMVKEMNPVHRLRNAGFRSHAMQQIGSIHPDILAVYLPDPRGHTDSALTAIMKSIEELCKEQFQEGGHYMVFANHAAKT
ncbi:hypothetical protein N9L68_03295 [bacterium]|nr:hypothetical protein [bacterium]